jgi:type I restriction enzyme S subunit
MTATERVLAHFDRISEAPDAIARLRRFILDLAVRGTLVDQDPNDEPASELVERIQAEKRAVGIRTSSKVTAVDESDLPFPVPDGWAWVQIGLVASDRGQAIPSQSFTYIDVTSIDKEVGRIADPKVLLAADAPSRARKLAQKGDLLYSCVRPYLLNVAVIDRDFTPPPIASTAFAVLNGFGLVVPRYLWIALRSPAMVTQVESKMRGQAYPAINDSDVKSLPLPLPPLAEQHRIVAKVDELMALCDRLEAGQKERESRRDRLVGASLARLNQPADPLSFREYARFHLDHLPRTTTSREHIKLLRQTILNLAVRGMLVPQDPRDEPASDLLAKGMLLPDGTQRRRKILKKTSAQASAELFPTIPRTWEYATIQNLYDLNVIIDYADGNHGSLYPRSSEFGDSGVTFVTARDIGKGRVSWSTCAKLNETRASQLPKGWARGGDVLLTHNATVGRVARVEADVDRFLLGTSVTFYRLNADVLDPDFFFRVLESPLWQGQLEAIMAQTTRNQVSIQKQAFFRVVVPPIGEQRRIVARVDQLSDVCDRLEAQFEAGRVALAALLDATLRDALSRPESAPEGGAQ